MGGRFAAICTVAAALALNGCAGTPETQSSTTKDTPIGAGIGADGRLGAMAGNVWSQRMERQKQEMEQAAVGTGVKVTRTADNRLKLDIPSDISFGVLGAGEALLQKKQSELETQRTNQQRAQEINYQDLATNSLKQIVDLGKRKDQILQDINDTNQGNIFQQIVGMVTIPYKEAEVANLEARQENVRATLSVINEQIKSSNLTTRQLQNTLTEIRPDFRSILDNFARSLTTNPDTQVTIIGHTDNSGTDAVNLPLSLSRAAKTRDYLVSRGASTYRINIDGRGSSEPIVANDTSAHMAKNRRVEIFVAERAVSE